MKSRGTTRANRLTLAKRLFLGMWALAPAAVAEQAPVLLKDTRAKLVFPAYTPAERQGIADQTFLVLDQLFVHRELKVQEFGAALDPVPRMAAIRAQASGLDDEALQEDISHIFLDLHDLHSSYSLPAPFSCGVAFLPVQFTGVRDNGVPKVVVSGLIALGSAYTKDIKVGLELVSVNGRPTAEVISDLERISGGANPDAMRFRAIQLLSMRSLKTQKVPQEDTVHLQFTGPAGSVDVEIPWLTLLDESCVAGQMKPEIMPFRRASLMAEDEFQKHYVRLFGQPSLKREMAPELRAADPLADIFQVGMLDTPAGKLGYIRIKSFYWNNPQLEVETVVEAFRTAIETRLASARAIVVDVRGNPGGLITFAEKILQLFAPQGVQPTKVRMLANDLNKKIFLQSNNGQENRWSQVVEDAMATGHAYTAPLAITPDSEANDIGQIWFRPVVVLTDAGCYSACDLFAAGMQDNKAATILGTYATTGAGGANVMDYSTFETIMEGASLNPFKKLPHRQGMRISWRQLLRSGLHSGALIEGAGIKSDVVVPLTSEDVQSESRQLMREIHAAINRLEPSYQSSVQSSPRGLIRLNNDASAQWTENVVGIDRLVVTSGENILFDRQVTPSTASVAVPVEIASLNASWRDQLVTVNGWRAGRQVFRVVRTLAWRGAYVPVEQQGITLDFESSDLTPLHTYMLQGDEQQGWQAQGGKLRIGNKATYDGGIQARALLPLQLSGKSAKVSFTLALKSEELYDSLRIFAINPDTGARMDYYAGSDVQEQAVSFELPKEWQQADLIFEFQSDENWNFAGPTIDQLKVEPASGG